MRGFCAKPSCSRKEQNGGLCKVHYRLATRGLPTGRVAVGPIVDHINALAAAGISNAHLGRICGIPQANVWQIVNGRRKFVLASTAAKILAVPIPHAAWSVAEDGAKVPALGTARRLRALMASGWTGRYIAQRIGVHHRAIHMVTSGTQQYITARVARAAAELFTELQLTPGPSNHSRHRAAARGWAPPLAWDEDLIDDPDAKPDELKPRRTTRLEKYEDLHYLGCHDDEIAMRMGITRDDLKRVAQMAAS